MARLTFQPGIRFSLKGEWFLVREILLERQILVQNQSFGGQAVKPLAELEQAFTDGELRFEVRGPHLREGAEQPSIPIEHSIQDFDTLPEGVREEARRRYQIIRPILDWPSEKRTRTQIEEYIRELRGEEVANVRAAYSGEKKPSPRKGKKRGTALSRTSVERWLKEYEDSGQDTRSLVDQNNKIGRPGFKRLASELESIITQVLDECEKNRHYRTVETIYLMVVHRIALENRTRPPELVLKLPSRPTVYNRVHEHGAESLLRRRRSRVERQSDEPVQEGPRPTRILERVEFDGTDLDLIVVDLEDRLPIGRPCLSYALDKFSGYPLGLYVGFEPRGYAATMSCALHAFSPKPDATKLYGTKNPWLARGLPELAVIDNGPEYVNRHMLDAFGMLGVPVDQCPVFTPWFKASIERFFKTNNTGLIHELPGTTFSNVLELGDYEAAQHACISLSGLVQMLHLFLLDYYAQKWNEGVGGIPANLWCESEQAGFIPTFPASRDELRILLFRNETRTLQRAGIEFENIVYQSHDLIRLRTILAREERQVKIRVNPDDLSYIYVLDPLTHAEWLKFTANDKTGYTRGLSLWKHRAIQKYVRMQKSEVDLFALAEAKAKIQKIVEQEYSTTRKMKHRKSAARFRTEPPTPLSIPESVLSQGFSLVPKLGTPQADSERTPTETTAGMEEAATSTGWSGDYRLPQITAGSTPHIADTTQRIPEKTQHLGDDKAKES